MRVEAYKEYDRRRCRSCFPKDFSHSTFRFSHKLVEQLEYGAISERSVLTCCGLTSGPLTAIKFIPDSVARAFAVKVLLHPGGP